MNVPLKMASRNGLVVPEEYATRKLAIAWASGGHMEPEFWTSLLEFLLHEGSPKGRKIFAGIAERRSPYVDDNRNLCVRDFLNGPADTLLFVDPDHRYGVQQVYALIDSLGPDRAIVGGLYFNYWQDGNIYPVWRQWNEDGSLGHVTRVKPDEMIEVAAVGAGFMAVQRRVFEEMEKAKLDNGNWPWFGRDVVQGVHVGEDVTFCLRAAKLGFKVWGNSHVIVDHKKGTWLNWDSFTKHWQAQGLEAK
jgi:hypothetical protein